MSLDVNENEKIGKTPHYTINSSLKSPSCSVDSGYLSLTPHSNSYKTHSKLSHFSVQRFNKSRTEPYASKINRKLNRIHSNFSSTFNEDSLRITCKNSATDFSNLHSRNSFTMELRSHQKRQRQIPVSPMAVKTYKSHSFRDILVTPSLTSVPLSPFACKSSDNDIEIKLVISQSTPCAISSPILPIPLCSTIFSPISCKANCFIDSVNSKKFNNLSISDQAFVSKKSRPQRLDFSKQAIFASFQKQRITPDYNGQETVDIFKLLGEKSNHPRIISKILDYLSPQDLCSINMVSKSWQNICDNDTKAQERRLKYVLLKQSFKENIVTISKCKIEEVQMSPKSRYTKRGLLTAVSTNLLQTPKIHLTPTSPPVSPSKVIFHSFVKAGRSLAPRDQLVPCPQCKFACRVELDKNVGTCSRKGCQMEFFCVLCSSELHVGEPCKMPLLATPTKRGKHQQSVVGTKQCKRSLRRLSRLI